MSTNQTPQAPQTPPVAEEKALALPYFGDRSQVRELAERLKYMIVGGRRLEPAERIILAQVSIAHELDPTTGEIWYIPGSGPMVGIKGLRKHARKQARRDESTYWLEFVEVDPKELGETKAGAVAYECRLRDTKTVQAWATSINSLTSATIPYKEAVTMLGPTPVTIGIGIADPSEKSKMPLHARAKKRAEADAIKVRYDVDFPGIGTQADEPEILPGDFVDLDETAQLTSGDRTPEEIEAARNQALTEMGF